MLNRLGTMLFETRWGWEVEAATMETSGRGRDWARRRR